MDEAYQSFIGDFETAHEGVTINALETPPEFDTQLLVDLAAGSAPHVWNQDGSTLARLVDSGYVLDMNECIALVPEFNTDRFFPSVLAIHQPEADGAIYGVPNRWQSFWGITLPLLTPTTLFLAVTGVIGSFQVFAPVYVITKGGPLGSTDVAMFHIYQRAFQNFDFGYASAQSWVLFAVIFVATLIQLWFVRRRGEESQY